MSKQQSSMPATRLGLEVLEARDVPSGGNGLTGRYFDNVNFTNLALTRVDPTVNFNWGSGSFEPGFVGNTFSVRWTGQVQPQFSQTYTFTTVSDDGVRLWVNGQLLINNWTDHAATENSGTITLVAGRRYDIRMEYFENTGPRPRPPALVEPEPGREVDPAPTTSYSRPPCRPRRRA